MRYQIILAPEAVEDLNALRAATKSIVKDALQRHLGDEPTKVSKSRIKRLRLVLSRSNRVTLDDYARDDSVGRQP